MGDWEDKDKEEELGPHGVATPETSVGKTNAPEGSWGRGGATPLHPKAPPSGSPAGYRRRS